MSRALVIHRRHWLAGVGVVALTALASLVTSAQTRDRYNPLRAAYMRATASWSRIVCSKWARM
jgi:negative regulator of sigma E activity